MGARRSDRPPHLSTGGPRSKATQQNLVVALTLMTGFGILDVGYGFGAQGPDGDSQL